MNHGRALPRIRCALGWIASASVVIMVGFGVNATRLTATRLPATHLTSADRPTPPAAHDKNQEPVEKLAGRPAPTGFKDFRLGMTRQEVHALLAQWPRIAIETTTKISGIPYDGIACITVRFSDGQGLLLKNSFREGGWKHLVQSRDLRPDEAEERLEQLVVELAELKGGSPEQFLEELRRQYGTPFTDVPPKSPAHALDFPEYTYRHDVGPVFTKTQVLEWYSPEVDRTVTATLTRYGQHTFGNLETFGAHLQFVDGLGRARIVAAVLEDYRTERENQKTERVRRAFRDGIGGASQEATAPDSGPTLPTAAQLDGPDQIPEALIGRWHLRGQIHGVWKIPGSSQSERLEGYLTLGRSSDARLALGTIEWLEGPSLETVKIAAAIGTDARCKDVLLLALCSEEVETGDAMSFPKGLYLAAIVREGDAWTLRAGAWEEKNVLSWRARKLPEEDPDAARGSSIEGRWQLVGGFNPDPQWTAVCVLREEDQRFLLRRISGTYDGENGWTRIGIGGRVKAQLTGSYNVRTRRLWLRAVAGQNLSDPVTGTTDLLKPHAVGYLSADGTRLSDGSEKSHWKGIRDELIPLPKRQWWLHLPNEAVSGGLGGGGVHQASLLLERILDAYDIDIAVPLKSGGYTRLSRKKDAAGWAASHLAELPADTVGFSFSAAEEDAEGYYHLRRSKYIGNPFRALLKRYQLPLADTIVLIAPPKLYQEMERLALEELKARYQTDDRRRIRETRFRIEYDRRENRLHLKVQSLIPQPLQWE